MSFILLTIIALFLKSATSQDLRSMPNIYLHENCSGDGQFDQQSEYQTNLNHLLSNLTSNSASQNFYNLSIGESRSKVYGLYHCYYAVDNQLCQKCIQTAANRILKSCTSNVEAIVWYFLCMLRYSNTPIFSINDLSKYYLYEDGKAEYDKFSYKLSKSFNSLFDVAASRCSSLSSASTVSFLEGDVMMNAHVECTPDLSESDCRSCLRTALTRFEIQGYQLGVLVQPSCQLSSAFVDAPSLLTSGSNTKLYIGIGVASGIAAIALTLMAISIYCLKKPKNIYRPPSELDEIESMENLHMEYDAIKDATDKFSKKNELGRGGFGVVYKGKLGRGKVVAVKRLFSTSKQGVEESNSSQQKTIDTQFEAEACLSAKLQHKNLVKVYGFCRKKDEKLLVYEFVANKSLDRFLNDPKLAKEYLTWETRYKIILGVARGLFYLHEDSSPKIIHRDIKPGNILLDDQMNPKIADFGLSRMFAIDKSHTNTKTPAGTIGFMDPNHLVTGNISVELDVYSYGVMILAIVSGFRIRCSNAEQENFLCLAWKLWSENKHLDLVDSTLGDTFEQNEAKRCIQVGLLCAQKDPPKRPNNMGRILKMLDTELNIELPRPDFTPVSPHMQEATTSYASTGTTIHEITTEIFPR